MNKRYLFAASAATSLLLTACAPQTAVVPMPIAHPYSEQLVMQSIHHWDELAAKTAERIYQYWPQPQVAAAAAPVAGTFTAADVGAPPTEIGLSGNEVNVAPKVIEFDFSKGVPEETAAAPVPMEEPIAVTLPEPATAPVAAPPLPNHSLYINPPRQDQDALFGRSFHAMLKTELVKRGIIVTANPNSAGTFCTQLSTCRPLILDYNIKLVPNPHVSTDIASEVMVATTIMDGDVVVFGETQTYYVSGADNHLYERQARTFKVVNK